MSARESRRLEVVSADEAVGKWRVSVSVAWAPGERRAALRALAAAVIDVIVGVREAE